MQGISDLQRNILESAQANGGWYHLHPNQPGAEARLEWEACQSFVAGDYAKWLAKGQPAGIVLTDKALRLFAPSLSDSPVKVGRSQPFHSGGHTPSSKLDRR